MATQVTKWQAKDGSLHSTENEADMHDLTCRIAKLLFSVPLTPPSPWPAQPGLPPSPEPHSMQQARALLREFEVIEKPQAVKDTAQ